MRVRDRESLSPPEERTRRGNKRLAEHHWRHRDRPEESAPIVQRLGATPDGAGIEGLIIVRRLAEAVQPAHESIHRGLHAHDRQLTRPHGRLGGSALAGTTRKLSIRFSARMDLRIAASFCICSLRWNRTNSSETGRPMPVRQALAYPAPIARPPMA